MHVKASDVQINRGRDLMAPLLPQRRKNGKKSTRTNQASN